MDDLGLEQPNHGLGEGAVAAVADTADGKFDANLCQMLSVADADVLRSAIAVVNAAVPPAHDAPVEDVNCKSEVDHTGSGARVGEGGDPKLVQRRAWNRRLLRSNGRAAALSDMVVLTTLPPTTPSSPSRVISGAKR